MLDSLKTIKEAEDKIVLDYKYFEVNIEIDQLYREAKGCQMLC